MSEVALLSEAARATLRRSLGHRLGAMQPPLRVLAEDVLALESRIDLVTRDPLGGVVLVLIGETDQDAALLTRALAHQSWVEQRIPDWLQLAPELALSRKVETMLVCPNFQPETLAAARTIAPPTRISFFRYRPDSRGEILLDPVSIDSPDPTRPLHPPRDERSVAAPGAPTAQRRSEAATEAAPHAAEFRSGLSDSDLQLTQEERREFG